MKQKTGTGLQVADLPSLKRRDIFLLDERHGVSYNNFNLSDIVDGSLVECRNHAYALAVKQTSAWLHAGDLQGPVNEEHDEEETVSAAARTRQMLEGGDVMSMCGRLVDCGRCMQAFNISNLVALQTGPALGLHTGTCVMHNLVCLCLSAAASVLHTDASVQQPVHALGNMLYRAVHY